MRKRTYRKARRVLSLLLTIAMLVSSFCYTGISLPISAAGEKAKKITFTFKDNAMVTTARDAQGNVINEENADVKLSALFDGGYAASTESIESIEIGTSGCGRIGLYTAAKINNSMTVQFGYTGSSPDLFDTTAEYTLSVVYAVGNGLISAEKPKLKVFNNRVTLTGESLIDSYKSFSAIANDVITWTNYSWHKILQWDDYYADQGIAALYLIGIELTATDYMLDTDDIGGSTPTPTTYTLTVNQAAGGTVEVGDKTLTDADYASGVYTNDACTGNVTVTATANEGWKFVKWVDGDGKDVATNSAYTFTINTNTTLTPVFAQKHTLTTVVTPTSVGTVTVEADSANDLYAGDQVTLTATVTDTENYAFDQWTRNDGVPVENATNPTITITMPDNDVTFTANFRQIVKSTLTLQSEDTTKGTVKSPENPIAEGTQIKLNKYATANKGYKLAYWSDGDGKKIPDPSAYIMPAADTTLTAHFVEFDGVWIDFTGGANNVTSSNVESYRVHPDSVALEEYANNGKYGVLLDQQNDGLYIKIKNDVFASDDRVKVTVEYYYAKSDGEGETINSAETLHLGDPVTSAVDTDADVSTGDKWTFGDPDNDTAFFDMYLDDVSQYYDTVWEIALIRILQGNGNVDNKDIKRPLYIKRIELTAVDRKSDATLTVEASPEEGGTVSETVKVENGAYHTITATPAEGYRFVQWTASSEDAITYYVKDGDASKSFSKTSPTALIKVTDNVTMTAEFKKEAVVDMVIAGGSNATQNETTGQWVVPNNDSLTISNLNAVDSNKEAILDTTGNYVLELDYFLKKANVSDDEKVTVELLNGEAVVGTGNLDLARTPEAYDGVALNQGSDKNKNTELLQQAVITIQPTSGSINSLENCTVKIMLNGVKDTEMHVTEARLYSANTPWRYLNYKAAPKTISLDIKLFDHIPGGLLFEANMASGDKKTNNYPFLLDKNDVKTYVTSKGNGESFDTKSLVLDTLVDGHIVYKPIVVEYLVEKSLKNKDFYNQAISNLVGVTGTETVAAKEGEDKWMDLIELIQTLQNKGAVGSWSETLSKLENEQNGKALSFGRIQTLYDAAYYMLNTLFVADDNYNDYVEEYSTLTLQATDDGYYVFDSGYEQNYDYTKGEKGGEISNAVSFSDMSSPIVAGQDNATVYQFFPIDDLGYADRISSSDPNAKDDANYAFSMAAHGLFTYKAGQVFEFTGDDDLYLFINGQLAVSLDGLHFRDSHTLNLSDVAESLGLVEGGVYSFDLFFMERHTWASNLKIKTSIAVQQPTLDVGKHAYRDAKTDETRDEKAQGKVALKDGDYIEPFSTVYYEFTVANEGVEGDNAEAAPYYDIRFTDEKLDVKLNCDTYGKFQLNAFTKASELQFIVEENNQRTTYSFNGITGVNPNGDQKTWSSEEDYIKFIQDNVLFKPDTDGTFPDGKSGLKAGQTLIVQFVKDVLTKTLDNEVDVSVRYAEGELPQLGDATQSTKIDTQSKTYTVDYNTPLTVNPFTKDEIAKYSLEINKKYPTTYFGNVVLNKDGSVTYTLEKEMLHADIFSVIQSATYINENLTNAETREYLVSQYDTSAVTLPNGEEGETDLWNNGQQITCSNRTGVDGNVADPETQLTIKGNTRKTGNTTTRVNNSNTSTAHIGHLHMFASDEDKLAQKNPAWAQFQVTVPQGKKAVVSLLYASAATLEDAVTPTTGDIKIQYGTSPQDFDEKTGLPVDGDGWTTVKNADGSVKTYYLPNTNGWEQKDAQYYTFREEEVVLKGGNSGATTQYVRLIGTHNGINVFGIKLTIVDQDEVTTVTKEYEKVLTFVPANNVYYDDAFVKGTNETTGMFAFENGTAWTQVYVNDDKMTDYSEGATVSGTHDTIGERHTTVTMDDKGTHTFTEGTSKFGHGGNVAFENDTTFFNGTAMKGTSTSGNFAKMSFRFTGDGVDVFSYTDPTSGSILAVLYKVDADGDTTQVAEKVEVINCEYLSGALYQVPVISFYDLAWGTYEVKITVALEENKGFYFDGARIYHPMGEDGLSSTNAIEQYDIENEHNSTFISLRDVLLSKTEIGGVASGVTDYTQGVLFVDYVSNKENKDQMQEYVATTYKDFGPKHEVYLKPNQSIAFTVSGYCASIQVAAKAAEGKACTLSVTHNGSTAKTINVSSSMEMFYQLGVDANAPSNTYILTNASDSDVVLSLTKLKLTSERAVYSLMSAEDGTATTALASVGVTADTVTYATAVLNGDTETANAVAAKLNANTVERYGAGSVTPVLGATAAPVTVVEAISDPAA